MENSHLMYIVIGLLAIFFIVLLIFSAKTWRILHLMSAFFVFVGALFLVWFVAATLQTDANWRHAVTVLDAKVAAEEQLAKELLEGTTSEDERPVIPENPMQQIDYIDDSIKDVRAALERVLLDRGRVWRNCAAVVDNSNPDTATITLTIPATDAPAAGAAQPPADGAEPPADGAAPPAAPAGSHGIAENTVLYGFLQGTSELEGDLAGHTVPSVYLGEYRVTNRTDSSITIQTTIRLTPLQVAYIGAGPWTIYDDIPVDSTYAFDRFTEADLRILFPKDRLSMSPEEYGNRIDALQARYFPGLSPGELRNKVPMSSIVMTDAQYEAFIASFVRNGKPAGENDPLQRSWHIVTFDKPTIIQVDAKLENPSGQPDNAKFQSQTVVAIKRTEGDNVSFIIGERRLVPALDDDETIGTFPLGVTVSETLKQVSDYDLDVLWKKNPTNPAQRAIPPELRPLTELSPEELQTVFDAKTIEFDFGDTALVDYEKAKFLDENHIIKPYFDDATGRPIKDDTAIYVRQLRDFATYFNDGYRQELQFEDQANVIQQDTITLLGANAKALEQVTYRADEIGKLQTDREGFQREVVAITGVQATMDDRLVKTRARLSELFRTNVQLAERIRQMQADLVEGARGAADLEPEVIAGP